MPEVSVKRKIYHVTNSLYKIKISQTKTITKNDLLNHEHKKSLK